ncbi:uncharacterized protein LOC143283804 [Babylonia areolata]|uniref:uncharacterized protein LOC143283804 n=1 Tax=Babylonia areolata TaxID=304850 RepID=UPI003FD3B72D
MSRQLVYFQGRRNTKFVETMSWLLDHRPSLLVVFFALLCLSGTANQAHALCTLPNILEGTWHRVDTSTSVTITSSDTTGIPFPDSIPLSEEGYDCIQSSDTRYMFGTKGTFSNYLGGTSKAYFCWELTEESEATVLLRTLTETATAGTLPGQTMYEGFTSSSVPLLDVVCKLSSESVLPTLLYKTDGGILKSFTQSEQQCSPDLFATYNYVKDGNDCQGRDSSLDFCMDRSTARVDYTACDTKILFSEGGKLSCLLFFTKDSSTYQFLFNQDASPDGTTYQQFVCTQLTKSGDSEKLKVLDKTCTNPEHTLDLTITAVKHDRRFAVIFNNLSSFTRDPYEGFRF